MFDQLDSNEEDELDAFSQNATGVSVVGHVAGSCTLGKLGRHHENGAGTPP